MTHTPYDRDTVIGQYRLRVALANLSDAIAYLEGDVTKGEKDALWQALFSMQNKRTKMCQRIGEKHGDVQLDPSRELRAMDPEAYEDGELYRDIGEVYGYKPLGRVIASAWNAHDKESK